MTITRNLFAPSGPLALAPSAYASPFEAVSQPAPSPEAMAATEIACLYVQGPLVLRWNPDAPRDAMAYEWIQMLARCYFAAPTVKAVVLRVDSPGGVVSGAFETAQLLRELSLAAGKPLYTYIEGQGCSAAYALAAAATGGVYASASASVGSIGVIHPLADATQKNEKDGLRFVLVTSGERKADGNPLAPITDEAVAATQAHVDELAEIFFTHVNAMRPALSVETLRGLQAATFTGQKAAVLQLIDSVSTFDRVLALAANADIPKAKPMKLKAAAQAILDDDKASDEDKKEAKAYLASLEGDDEKDEASDDEKDDDKAEDDEPAKDDDKKDDDKGEAASASASAGTPDVGARLAALEADIARGKDAAQRRKILGSRPDLTEAQVKSLAKVPTVALAAALSAIPEGIKSGAPAAAVSPMAGALAAVSGETPTPATPPAAIDEARARRRARMGLGVNYAPKFEMRGDTLVLDMLATAPSASAPKAGAK